MNHKLQPQRSGLNYATMLGFEHNEDSTGPLNPVPLEYEPESDSEFVMEGTAAEGPYELLYLADDHYEEPDQFVPQSVTNIPFAPSPPKHNLNCLQIFNEQHKYLAYSKVHHCHSAVLLFFLLRDQIQPKLFQNPGTVLTNNFTFTPLVQGCLNKAWSYNIGSGPLWELMEDRG